MKLILTWLALLLVLTINALANILPINGMNTGQISGLYPNYFVPAGFTFSIWGFIYSLQIAYTITYTYYQIKKPADLAISTYFNQVHTLYLFTCLFNAGWILSWHYLSMPLSLICMISYLVLLSMIFMRGRIAAFQMKPWQQFLLFTPMVVYLGWICVATIANITAALVSWGFTGGPEWSVIMIGIATLLSTYITLRFRVKSHGLVLIWALWGIYNAQQDQGMIQVATLVGMAVVAVAVGMSIVRREAAIGNRES